MRYYLVCYDISEAYEGERAGDRQHLQNALEKWNGDHLQQSVWRIEVDVEDDMAQSDLLQSIARLFDVERDRLIILNVTNITYTSSDFLVLRALFAD